MKLALVIFNADPGRGGAEKYTADIAAALSSRGHEVDLLASLFGAEIPGVRFVELKSRGLGRVAKYNAFLDALDHQLNASKYDRIHAMLPVRRCDLYHPHAGMAKAALLTHRARESSGSRATSAIANRLNLKRRRYAQVEETLLQGSSPPRVICLSDYIKRSILNFYPDIFPRLVKLFNAVDLVKFDPASPQFRSARSAIREKFGIDESASLALMIAQHFDRKGLPQIIDALAHLRRDPLGKNVHLLVVGKDDPAQSRRHAETRGVADRIIFAGTTDRPFDFYAASDFFVLPTHHDSCSLTVLEALAMGLPVISTIYNGACEIMTDGKHGFVLEDPDDIPTLAFAMQELADPAIRAGMSRHCEELRPQLSFEKHLDRLEEIYRLPAIHP